jgi:hypothetical protein
MRIPRGETLERARAERESIAKTPFRAVFEVANASEMRQSVTTAIARDRKMHL